jgi:hypothetical protein
MARLRLLHSAHRIHARSLSASSGNRPASKTCRSRKGSDFARAATIRSGSSSSDISRSVSPSGSCRQTYFDSNPAPRSSHTCAPAGAREINREGSDQRTPRLWQCRSRVEALSALRSELGRSKPCLWSPLAVHRARLVGQTSYSSNARLSFGHDAGREMKKSQSAGCADSQPIGTSA